MNYGELLYKAHENNKSASNKSVPCYKTTFSAPKKLERPTVSSENIKRFLARKENEEKIKALEAKRKREELLALRSQDKKAQKRVQVMLKRTKSANKSVMEDAIDNINTRDTLDGPMQCDEDDYGYVSQEASAFYMKMINKYENQQEPSLFSKSRKEVKDLAAAKDRVKAALQKEEEESELPHKRKRKKAEEEEDDRGKEKRNDGSRNNEKHKNQEKNKYDSEKKDEKKKIKRPPPPAINFDQLLKLAEVKQHEPILIDTSAIPKEPERLMTEKEKAEFLKEEERKRNRGKRPPPPTPGTSDKKTKNTVEPKKNSTKSEPERKVPNKLDHIENERLKSGKMKSGVVEKVPSKDKVKSSDLNGNKTIDKSSSKKIPEKSREKPEKVDSVLSDIDREIELLKRKRMLLASNNAKSHQEYKPSMPSEKPSVKQPDRKPRPPLNRERPMQERRKIVPGNKQSKRRIDSDSEYDSELDDFIDDGPEEEQDYSKYISEIFGYDKSKYANVDDDDECMESNFAQQMKEEFVSTKIGILEDLEDIRKEQEEKKRMKERLKKKKMK